MLPVATLIVCLQIIFCLDARERFSQSVGRRRLGVTEAVAHHLAMLQQRGIPVESRHLAVGDALWVARSRQGPLSACLVCWHDAQQVMVLALGSGKQKADVIACAVGECLLSGQLLHAAESLVALLPGPKTCFYLHCNLCAGCKLVPLLSMLWWPLTGTTC